MNETYGRYRLIERLGKGGMAEVFKAKSFGVEGFEKVLVVKRILPELSRNARFVELFIHEAKLSVHLSHANIVQAFDLGMVGSNEDAVLPSYFIAMEYVAGLDLAALLSRMRRRSVPLPIGLCVFVASEVCKGLEHAHRRCDERREPLGIVHRDVSPQNVLLSWEGDVKLTDFGIAKARDWQRGQPEGSLAGKAAYMSPEQARGESVDARSDIFSLGTVLYEMVTGTNPFRAASTGETLARVQTDSPTPVHALRQGVDPSLSAILGRAMALSARERYSSAGVFHDELLGFMYATGTRFSSNDLIEYLAPLRASAGEELDVEGLLVDKTQPDGDDITPVEVPDARASVPPVRVTTTLPTYSYASTVGERREVTVLVIRTGVALSVAQSQRVKDTLARYGARLTDETRDGLVALLGLGEADGRETETAVRCALVVLRQLSTGRWGASAGVHTGRVQLHDSGEPARDDTYASIIEVASKLAMAQSGRCVVSKLAARQVRSLFELEPWDTDDGVMGSLVGEPRLSDDALRRFVGREDEYRQMGKVLAAAARRRLKIVTIRGDQGIGKTRFVDALERRLKRSAYHIGMYVACCPPLGKQMPLSGLSSMLRVLCGVKEGDGPERIATIEPRLRALGLTDEERGAVLGQLGALATDMVGPSVPPLRSAFSRMLQRLSEDRVHAFVWDDAQALDDDTFDVLMSAAKRLAGARAVLMFCTRSYAPHPLADLDEHSYVDLVELNDKEVSDLIAARAGLAHAPEELVAFCQQRAGGHPLFIEELIKELMETEALVVQQGQVQRLRLTGDIAAPRPLKSLLAGRLSRLEDSCKMVLHAMAVLASPAHVEVLSMMLGMGLMPVETAIATLEERGLVRRVGPSTSSLGSPLLREVVVDSIAPEGRGKLHEAAAMAYENVLGGQVDALADRVGYHLLEAGEKHRAARLFALSAGYRKRSGQLEGALSDYLRAFDLVSLADCPVDTLLQWLAELRDVVRRVRAGASLLDVLQRVVARVDKEATLSQRVMARVDGASMLTYAHRFDAAMVLLDEALELAGSNEPIRSLTLLTQAQLFGIRGEFGAAVTIYEQMGDRLFEGKDAVRYDMGLAQAYGATGQKKRALEYLERATAISEPGDVGAAMDREKLRA